MRRLALALVALLVAGSASTLAVAERVDRQTEAAFQRFATDYVDAYLTAHPVRATQLGVHQHDGRLADLSPPAVRGRVHALRAALERLLQIDARVLTGSASFDYRLLDHAIRAELLELEDVRGWQRDPALYSREMADGVASLVERQFAPLAQRVAHVISRLEHYPAITHAARENLRDVPAVWADLAAKSTRGHLSFLRDELPATLRAQGFGQLPAELRSPFALARRSALQELEQFAAWLETELLPEAHGDFRLGRELFERKLLYEEHIAMSVDELVATNERAIDHYRQWIVREAARLDPARPVEQVLQDLVRRHPSPRELIPAARRAVARAQEFVRARQLVTLPSDQLPIVRPMPDSARSGFASMSAAGPFESVATEAYFNLTNVDPAWSKALRRQHLTYFHHAGLLGIGIHEVMPGHYVHMLYRRELPSDVRKVFVPASLTEGWAHYAEQMMIDQGLGDGDPALRLGQLRRALQRHARWYVATALHAGNATLEDAARRFADIAYFAPFPAMRETVRGTYDPTYLVYALGRMQILELREDYRRHRESRGETFSLREFHDRLLRLGLPIALAREAMVPSSDARRGGFSAPCRHRTGRTPPRPRRAGDALRTDQPERAGQTGRGSPPARWRRAPRPSRRRPAVGCGRRHASRRTRRS